MKKKLLIVLLCAFSVNVFAQAKKTAPAKKADATTAAGAKVETPVATAPAVQAPVTPAKPFERPVDGYFVKKNILTAQVTPYPTLREADVVMSKRIWSEFDLRETRNKFMGSPKARLIDVLMEAIANEELTAYDPNPHPELDDPNGDAFSTPLTAAGAKAKMADSSVVDIIDSKGEKTGTKLVAGEFNPDSIVRFRIKEDWIFDKQRSVWEPRIIGIAPMIKPTASGVELELQPAFWVYFPAARQVLATKEVFMGKNDNTGLSYDDVFLKRMFTSYIVKESNAEDVRIKDYAEGIDRLYESERVKKEMMDWELNLWQY
ncbi:MAG: gliding motility protein GldN [Sphingobacteriaceae bacterium]|nr:MAG: gliding motility protein GldN [Sphingobacteriaceae bacterium]